MMLGLKLRSEFSGKRLQGTAIELADASKQKASAFLDITYPTADVLKTLEAVSPAAGRPVTLVGERGQGKSHLMAMLCHAFSNNSATAKWLENWSSRLKNPKVKDIPLRKGFHVISASLHQQRQKFLWDLVFEQHPDGKKCQGKFEALKTDVPSDEILIELFTHTPTALILDEFQTWFDGLTDSKAGPHKTWAFNFIQILSEIAKEHPDKLVLVVSVRNGRTDAFQQIQRVSPVIVDFKGPSAKQDRLKLLLHRLFENRIQIAEDKISSIVNSHVDEFIRLKGVAPAEQERTRQEFTAAWPFAPHLMDLLEDQVLMATQAQETRDLIRILAGLFKDAGAKSPIITAADFSIEDAEGGITALLDSVANQHHSNLRQKALRNLEAVRDAEPKADKRLPHLSALISSLWLRSLADSNHSGADLATLQVDLTKDAPLDENAFLEESSRIFKWSFNIHEVPSGSGRYMFREPVNPEGRLRATAENDKEFKNEEDKLHLAKEMRYVIASGPEADSRFRIIVMPQYWSSEPWQEVDESDRPENWDDRIPILILPEAPADINSKLGTWLKENLQKDRNAVRFLIPRVGVKNLYGDKELITLSRLVYLAEKWASESPEYGAFKTKFQKELRAALKSRMDRFSIISNWNFQEPEKCQFTTEKHRAEGNRIPEAIDTLIKTDIFIPEDFNKLILDAAPNNEAIGKIIRELREPRPGSEDCIPWLGETDLKEKIIRLCSKGKIAINIRGTEYLQLKDGESEEDAWKRMRGKLGMGRHLNETYLLTPQDVPNAGGSGPATPQPTPPAGTPTTPGTTPEPGTPPGGSAFPPASPGNIEELNFPPTSALNLLGKIETRGVNPGSQLRQLQLKVSKLTGAQLQDLLKKLPDGMTYELGVEKENF
ncbi:MAG: DUF499 domain-containing protein [Planctomycetota bacterium]